MQGRCKVQVQCQRCAAQAHQASAPDRAAVRAPRRARRAGRCARVAGVAAAEQLVGDVQRGEHRQAQRVAASASTSAAARIFSSTYAASRATYSGSSAGADRVPLAADFDGNDLACIAVSPAASFQLGSAGADVAGSMQLAAGTWPTLQLQSSALRAARACRVTRVRMMSRSSWSADSSARRRRCRYPRAHRVELARQALVFFGRPRLRRPSCDRPSPRAASVFPRDDRSVRAPHRASLTFAIRHP